MFIRFSLCIVAALMLAGPVAAQPVPESAVDEEFRQALMRLVESGALPDDGQIVVVERPAERVANFGLLIDSDDRDGLRVLGTLPGGSAERIGLRTGDRLLAANDVDLRGDGGSARMRSLLDGLDDGDTLTIKLQRGERELELAGTVDAIQLPAMRVELQTGSAPGGDAGHVSGDPDSTCARVTTFPAAPRTRDLFPANLIAVDGRSPGTVRQDSFRVSPGRHVLTVAENIDPRFFSGVANSQRSRRASQLHKTIEVDIRPGVTYLLAARFIRDRSGEILDGSYWQPVIWKERAESCR